MKNTINIGIMGCGWIAENAHIKALKEIRDADVISVFDADINRAKNFCEKYSIHNYYVEIGEFFQSGIDAVIIATPNFTHAEYTLKALERGISVLCEKPVAFCTKEIEAIREAAKKNHVVYVPGFVNRWRKDIKEVYGMIQSGAIGAVTNLDAGWIRKHGVPRPGTWFTNRECSGGGVLMDLGSHILDICNLFMGEEKPESYKLYCTLLDEEKVKSVGSAGWFARNDAEQLKLNVEDVALARVTYKNGAVLNGNLSWLSSVQNDMTYFLVTGEQGSIELRTLFGFSNERLWENDTLILKQNGTRIVKHLNMEENNTRMAFKEMLSYFIESVKNNATEYADVEDAWKTVNMIEQLYKEQQVNEETTEQMLLQEIKFVQVEN